MAAYPLSCVVAKCTADGDIIEQTRLCDPESAVQAIRRQQLDVVHALAILDANEEPTLVLYATARQQVELDERRRDHA